jgi:MOSC domain-containing protein YiiM
MLMEQFHTGLKSALTPDWRAGVCCDVISGGKIQIGDAVRLS